ncbi:MAG: hypothetical protein OXC57_06580 [Rhodobacteraceae bacterium]|nr:hypothetical protein [Paracoccaceae bacterium]
MTNKNAHVGKNHERIFADEVQKNPQTIKDIVSSFTPQVPKRGLRIKIVELEGQHGEKSDVFIRTTGGHNYGANVKSFKGAGFNQVTRMKIDNFVEQFSLSEKFRNIIKNLTLAKAKNSRQNWITAEYADDIVQEINPKAFEIIKYSLLGDDEPELFVLIKSDSKIISIFQMEELLRYLEQSINVQVTPRGVLMLNECFSIQKKGGNGKHDKYSKHDLRHGGNNIQVKMKTGLILKKLNRITAISY